MYYTERILMIKDFFLESQEIWKGLLYIFGWDYVILFLNVETCVSIFTGFSFAK